MRNVTLDRNRWMHGKTMDVTDVIGPMGKAQYKVFLALLARPLPGVFVYLALQISMIELDHWCSPTPQYQNLTSEEWKECCVPMTDNNRYSRCEYKSMADGQNGTEQTLTCSSWEYNRSIPYQSARTEWNLVCDRGWYVSMLYMAFALGNLVAYIPSGHIADRIGRKPVCMMCIVLSACFSIVSALSPSVNFMLIMRFLSGITYAAIQNSFICLYLECVGQQYRDWVKFSFNGAYGLSWIITAGITYFITDWRTVFYVASIPMHLPTLLLLWILVPESARWLLSVKRYDEAEKVIRRQAKENGIVILDFKTVLEKLKIKVHMDRTIQKQGTIFDLFKDPSVRRTTILIYLMLFLTVFVNHGYNISIPRFGGSLHINMMLTGTAEFCAMALQVILLKYFSRKRGLLLCFFLTGMFFLLTIPVRNDQWWLRATFVLIARFSNATSYILLYVLASEVFPTNLRVAGVGGGMTSGRVAAMLASFTNDLGRLYGNGASMGLFGVASLLTCVLIILLPDMSNRNLSDSLEETKVITSGRKPPEIDLCEQQNFIDTE